MKTTVKSRLAEVLKNAGMTVSELAKASKVDYPTVYRISAGDTLNPSRKTLAPIATALKINLDWLHKGIGDRDAIPTEEGAGSPYRDFAIKHLTEEIAYYRQLLMQVTGGKGFLRLINKKPHHVSEAQAFAV